MPAPTSRHSRPVRCATATTFVINGAEDLDQLRGDGRLLLPHLPHLDRRASPRRDQRADRAARLAGHHHRAHPGHDDQPPLLRGLLRRRAGARRQPRRRRGRLVKQTMRQLEHERGGIDRLVSNYALTSTPGGGRPRRPFVRQEVAASSRATGIGRLLVLREVMGQAPKVVLRGHQDVLHRARAAGRRLRRTRGRGRATLVGRRPAKASAMRRRTRSWAAPRTCCATSSANESSVSPASRRDRVTEPGLRCRTPS